MKPRIARLLFTAVVFCGNAGPSLAAVVGGSKAGGGAVALPGSRPSTIMPADRYAGPTADLTAVANALRLNSKSLTTLITVQPNVPVTKPVDMTIVYISPASAQPHRVTQSYVRSTGNRFLYNDPQGDGTLRRLTMDITLTEPKPGGGVIPFQFYWHANLDPLYDVSTTALNFTMLSDCDSWITGDQSEIRLVMIMPDGSGRRKHFNGWKGTTKTVQEFAWARQETSASANLKQPYAMFGEHDPSINPAGSPTFLKRDMPPLIPGKTQIVRVTEHAKFGGSCRASIVYTLRHSLRFYPYLG